jgi:hypothetical protein
MIKQKFNKTFPVLTFAIACLASSAYAQYAGTFGYGLELDGTGTGAVNSGVTTLYALNNGGTTRLTPLGSSAVLNQTSWLSSPESGSGPTFSLGTFNPGAGDTLDLQGASMLTYQGGGATVGTAVYLNYRISPLSGPLSSWPGGTLLGLNESNVAGNSGDTRWSNESISINLLNGLSPGTYILGTYGYASSTVGDQYVSNGGLNYGATFTVVATPEPATMALAGLGGLATTLLLRRRQS